ANFDMVESQTVGLQIPEVIWKEMDFSPVGPYALKDKLGGIVKPTAVELEFKAENAVGKSGFQLEVPAGTAFVFEMKGI
ncbi:MAG: hypothetical protein AAF570_11970, partial [Bacteroidota bacterium]